MGTPEAICPVVLISHKIRKVLSEIPKIMLLRTAHIGLTIDAWRSNNYIQIDNFPQMSSIITKQARGF